MEITVYDPTGAMVEGSVVEPSQQLELAKLKGLVTLPVDPSLLPRNPVGGFFLRYWGQHGVPFIGQVPTYGCAMLVWATPEQSVLHWSARIMRYAGEAERAANRRMNGVLRMVAASEVPGSMNGGLRPEGGVDLSQLGPADEQAGWSVGGTCGIQPTIDGYIAVKLAGACTGIEVHMSAVSVSR